MTVPQVSLVMSVFNGQPYLGAAVDSILAQTWRDFEFIVIDDGSTDDSGSLLRRYAESDARVVIITNERNLGLTPSLNLGLRRARGAYMARQDADDLSSPERLACQVAFLDAHPTVGVVGTLSQVIDAEGQVVEGTNYHSALIGNLELKEQLLHDNPICHGSVLMRRELVIAVGGYDETIETTQDYDLWLRLAEVTEFANLEAVLYYYRVHPGSVGRTRYARQTYDKARVLARSLRRRQAKPPPERLAVAAHHYLVSAQMAYQQGNIAMAARAMTAALELSPTLFGRADLRDELDAVFTPNQPLAVGRHFTSAVFAGLRSDAALARLERRLMARLYMREVFDGHSKGDLDRVRQSCWPALRHDPRWLLNRGVVRIVLKAFLTPSG